MSREVVLALCQGEYSDVTFTVLGIYDIASEAFEAARSHLLASMLDKLNDFGEELTPEHRADINKICDSIYCNLKEDKDGSMLIENRWDGNWPNSSLFWRMESYHYKMWRLQKGIDKHQQTRLEYRQGGNQLATS